MLIYSKYAMCTEEFIESMIFNTNKLFLVIKFSTTTLIWSQMNIDEFIILIELLNTLTIIRPSFGNNILSRRTSINKLEEY